VSEGTVNWVLMERENRTRRPKGRSRTYRFRSFIPRRMQRCQLTVVPYCMDRVSEMKGYTRAEMGKTTFQVMV
jgi:hypothetical protein